jgi:hypothetical protein
MPTNTKPKLGTTENAEPPMPIFVAEFSVFLVCRLLDPVLCKTDVIMAT